jgi:hypothetical protein
MSVRAEEAPKLDPGHDQRPNLRVIDGGNESGKGRSFYTVDTAGSELIEIQQPESTDYDFSHLKTNENKWVRTNSDIAVGLLMAVYERGSSESLDNHPDSLPPFSLIIKNNGAALKGNLSIYPAVYLQDLDFGDDKYKHNPKEAIFAKSRKHHQAEPNEDELIPVGVEDIVALAFAMPRNGEQIAAEKQEEANAIKFLRTLGSVTKQLVRVGLVVDIPEVD